MTTQAEHEQRERIELAMKVLNGDKITKKIKLQIHQLTGLSPVELLDFNLDRRKYIAEKLIGRSVWVSPRTKIGRVKGWGKSEHLKKAARYDELRRSVNRRAIMTHL